jgi:biopolymer transport protein ExbB
MLEKLIQGGYIMVPLMACSVIMLAVLIEKYRAFRLNDRVDIRALRARTLELLETDRIDEAMTVCAATPSPISAVMLVGLQTYKKALAVNASLDVQRSLMVKAMDDYTPLAVHVAEVRLNWLATISNVAPLFGMTGTVTGMIRSFGSLAGAGSLDAGAVSAGIAEALVATAAGLVIALCSLIPYNGFMNRIEKMTLEIGEASTELVEATSLRYARMHPAS